MRVFGSLAVFVQCERYMTAVFYHLAGINGLHQREPDGYLMCAKETGGRALAQALAAFNQSSVGRTDACVEGLCICFCICEPHYSLYPDASAHICCVISGSLLQI